MSSLSTCEKDTVSLKHFPCLNKQSFVSVAEEEDPECLGDILASVAVMMVKSSVNQHSKTRPCSIFV